MTITSSKSIQELHAIIKSNVIESHISPIRDEGDKSLFFGTIKENRFKLFVLPENPWIKKPSAQIILKIIDRGENRLIYITFPKYHKVGLYMILIGGVFLTFAFLTEIGALGLLGLSLPFGIIRNVAQIIGWSVGKQEAIKRIEILRERIDRAEP